MLKLMICKEPDLYCYLYVTDPIRVTPREQMLLLLFGFVTVFLCQIFCRVGERFQGRETY